MLWGFFYEEIIVQLVQKIETFLSCGGPLCRLVPWDMPRPFFEPRLQLQDKLQSDCEVGNQNKQEAAKIKGGALASAGLYTVAAVCY